MSDDWGISSFIDDEVKEIKKDLIDVKKKVAMTVIKTLVRSTPVDTSNALSNWQITLNAPATNTLSPYAAGKRGSTESQSAGQTVAAAGSELANMKPEDTIYITNNADYIQDLEDGTGGPYSKPAGFVRKAEIVARRVINNAIFK